MVFRLVARQKLPDLRFSCMLDFVWISDRDLISTFQNWTASVAWRRSQRFASSVTRTASPQIGRAGPRATKVTTDEVTITTQLNRPFEDNQESNVTVEEEQTPFKPGFAQLDVEKCIKLLGFPFGKCLADVPSGYPGADVNFGHFHSRLTVTTPKEGT